MNQAILQMNTKPAVEPESPQKPADSFSVLQELRKDFKNPRLFPALLELAASGHVIPEAESCYAETLRACVRPFAKQSFLLALKNTAVGQQLLKSRKTDDFEKKYLKEKFATTPESIVNGFSFYKISEDAAVVARIQEIYRNPLDWENRYLTLNYFLSLKSQMQEKMQNASKKAWSVAEQHEKAGGEHHAIKLRNSMKKALRSSRARVTTTNFILFLHAALPLAYGNINEQFTYQGLFIYRDFIRSLRAQIEMIVQHTEKLLHQETEAMHKFIEKKRENLIKAAKKGEKLQGLNRHQLEKIDKMVQKEQYHHMTHVREQTERLYQVKAQAHYLKNLESSIAPLKKPKIVFEDHLGLPQQTFKEIEKLPHHDIDAKAEIYLEEVCLGIGRCASMVLLHEYFKSTLEKMVQHFGDIWPIHYAHAMLEAQTVVNQSAWYAAHKLYTASKHSDALQAEKNKVVAGCNGILRAFNVIENQAKNTPQFERLQVEFLMDKALLLQKLLTEVYSVLEVSANIKIKHVAKGVAALKSAESLIATIKEKDPEYEARLDENARQALVTALYAISSLLILEEDDEDDESMEASI